MTQKLATAATALLKRMRGEPIANRDELAAVAIATTRKTIERDQLILQRDEALQKIKEEYALQIEEYEDAIERDTRRMRAWAEANRDAFGDKQSLVVAGHELAWRKSPGKVETIKGVKEADAVEYLLEHATEEQQEKLLSIKATLDKKGVQKAWEAGEATICGAITAAGIEVVKPEEFTFKPDRSKIDSAPVKVEGGNER